MSVASSSVSVPKEVIQLRRFWFTRINGCSTRNPTSDTDGRVPDPEYMTDHWRGRWGYDDGLMFACLPSGDMMFAAHSGELDAGLISVLNALCPKGSELRVPYMHGEDLRLEEVARRFAEPYAQFD